MTFYRATMATKWSRPRWTIGKQTLTQDITIRLFLLFLTSNQQCFLSNIIPVVFQRYPNVYYWNHNSKGPLTQTKPGRLTDTQPKYFLSSISLAMR